MALRYTIEEVSKNGAADRRTETFEVAEVTLGRGAGCTVVLDSSFVSLKHAVFALNGDLLAVEDLGSLSGTKVNGRIVSRQQLSVGDEVALGDIALRVTRSEGMWELTERRLTFSSDAGEKTKADLDRLNIANRMPSFLSISMFLSIATLVAWFILPMKGVNRNSWSSGPVSNRHIAFSANCEACHRAPFTRVEDGSCLNCHRMSDHSPLLPASHSSQGSCTSCHMEHEGDSGLTVKKSEACTDCHGDIRSKNSRATTANVPSFAGHPEFSVPIVPALPGSAELSRVRLSDKAKLTDNSNIKLNHEIHLKGPLRSQTGSKVLQCRSCHESAADGRSLKPISFKMHCQECHSLGFDSRLPDKQVPHGNSPDEIFNFLYAEYAKLYLASKQDPKTQEAFQLRAKPGADIRQEVAPDADTVTRDFVLRESRSAEEMLFTKTACQLCHNVDRRSDMSEDAPRKESQSLFRIFPPQIPNHWMTQARFSHDAHDALQCESCHAGVKSSKDTKDVLLPGIDTCKNCHADPGNKTLVKSDCSMCHSFHDKLPLEAARQQKIEELMTISRGGA